MAIEANEYPEMSDALEAAEEIARTRELQDEVTHGVAEMFRIVMQQGTYMNGGRHLEEYANSHKYESTFELEEVEETDVIELHPTFTFKKSDAQRNKPGSDISLRIDMQPGSFTFLVNTDKYPEAIEFENDWRMQRKITVGADTVVQTLSPAHLSPKVTRFLHSFVQELQDVFEETE